MRFLMMVKANPAYEPLRQADPALLGAVGRLGVRITEAGVLLQSGGVLPSSKGARVCAFTKKRIVTDGPFAETKELIRALPISRQCSKGEASG